MLSIPLGQPARLSITLDIAGTLTDSTAMTLTVTEPDGTETTKTVGQLTHVSTGVYRYDFPTDQAGMHTFIFDSTEGVLAADDGAFFVRPTP